MEGEPKRPWWTRTLWRLAAAALALAAAYLLSVYPVAYAAGRGWIGEHQSSVPYEWLHPVVGWFPPYRAWLDSAQACHRLGISHRADKAPPRINP